MDQRFDDMYYAIAKETGGIEGLLNSLFSFLYRRTDFFYEADPGDKMGFPPGVQKKILLGIFESYQNEYYNKFPKKDPQEYAEKLKRFKEAKEALQQKNIAQQPQQQTKQPNEQDVKSTQQTEVQSEKQQINQIEQGQAQSLQVEEKLASEQPTIPPSTQVKDKVVAQKSSNISTYNGGVTEKYVWSQSVNDVTVQVNSPVPIKARDVVVDLRNDYLKITIKEQGSPLVDGFLYDKIKVDDSMWTIEDGKKIMLTLEKAQENIWKTVIKGDTEIDATQVDNSKKLDEFDDETQGALRKIMYEQQRKNMGLPTTEEEEQYEILKKAWNAEGSPFKGTPFDPTKLNLQGANNQFGLGDFGKK